MNEWMNEEYVHLAIDLLFLTFNLLISVSEVKPWGLVYSPPWSCDASLFGSEEESSIQQPSTNLPGLSDALLHM